MVNQHDLVVSAGDCLVLVLGTASQVVFVSRAERQSLIPLSHIVVDVNMHCWVHGTCALNVYHCPFDS